MKYLITIALLVVIIGCENVKKSPTEGIVMKSPRDWHNPSVTMKNNKSYYELPLLLNPHKELIGKDTGLVADHVLGLCPIDLYHNSIGPRLQTTSSVSVRIKKTGKDIYEIVSLKE